MSDAGDRNKEIDGWQGAVCAVGIFGGLLPLVRILLGGGPGRPVRWLNGRLGDPPDYLLPLCVTVVAVVLVVLLERAKQRT